MARALRGAAVAALAAAACRAPSASRDAGLPAQVVLESPSGRSSAVRVELARTPAEQERGLMFRQSLGADDGMLFLFPDTAEHTFWMKNTLIPLDMIFIDEGLAVVGIVADAAPLTLSPRSVGAPSRYVLEVNGGWSAAHGVAAGDRVRFQGFTP